MFFGKKKDPKKDNNPKCKVNTLARYMSLRPSLSFKPLPIVKNTCPLVKKPRLVNLVSLKKWEF